MENPAIDTAQALIGALAEAGEALERVVSLLNEGRPHGAAVVASTALGKIQAAVQKQVRD